MSNSCTIPLAPVKGGCRAGESVRVTFDVIGDVDVAGEIDVTVVLPCFNEKDAVGLCVAEAIEAMRDGGCEERSSSSTIVRPMVLVMLLPRPALG